MRAAGGLSFTLGASARPPSWTLASVRVPAFEATLSCLSAVLATLRPALLLRFAAALLTLRLEALTLRVALSLRFAASLVTLRVAELLLLRVDVPTLRVAAAALLWLAPLLILRVSRVLLIERLLAEGADLVAVDLLAAAVLAAFIFEEEPLLLLPPVDTLFVAALLLAGEFFCTLVEDAELADLLDCPITSIGLTHIITMMRESAIGANFFITVICLG